MKMLGKCAGRDGKASRHKTKRRYGHVKFAQNRPHALKETYYGYAVPRSQEYEELAHSIHELRLVFSGLPRPEGLPAPGEKLAPMTIPRQQRPGSGDSKPTSRVPSASRSNDNPSAEAGGMDTQAAAESVPKPKVTIQNPRCCWTQSSPLCPYSWHEKHVHLSSRTA